MSERWVLLDFDDTLNDPFRLVAQYARAVGALLAPQFGGSETHWAKAALDMLETLEAEYNARFIGAPLAGYCAWLDSIRTRSVTLLFDAVGIPPPRDAPAFMRSTQLAALSQCDATYPGAASAVRALSSAGYRLVMASGQESEYLQAALVGCGLETMAEMLFGPDLIDCAKEGPDYYTRIFARLGIAPEDAVVVDDQPLALQWAIQARARGVQSRISPERRFVSVPGVAAVVTDLAALPAIIHALFVADQT